MPFFYTSGQQILEGDRVLLNNNPGEVEFVADSGEGANAWYVAEFGGGVMVLEPKVFGRVFLTPSDQDYADLLFISRRQAGENGSFAQQGRDPSDG